MRCVYCGNPVVGHPEVITVTGVGAAHSSCYMNHQFSQRVFRGVDISVLCCDELRLLEELVKTERNLRSKASDDCMDFELF